VAVFLHQALLLPLDDLLSVVRKFLNPNVSCSTTVLSRRPQGKALSWR